MTDVVILSRRNFPIGTTLLPEAVLLAQFIAAGIRLDRANWSDPAVQASLQFECSLDSGANWISLGGFISEPGGHIGDAPVYASFLIPSGAQRRLRGSLIVSGGPLDTSVTARLLDGTEPDELP